MPKELITFLQLFTTAAFGQLQAVHNCYLSPSAFNSMNPPTPHPHPRCCVHIKGGKKQQRCNIAACGRERSITCVGDPLAMECCSLLSAAARPTAVLVIKEVQQHINISVIYIPPPPPPHPAAAYCSIKRKPGDGWVVGGWGEAGEGGGGSGGLENCNIPACLSLVARSVQMKL